MARTTRPPIIAVMGHIDHGKSSLLDYIRKTNIVAGESGGITQCVSAYEVEHEYEGESRRITFLDTPGHEAFHTLRARGASAADVAILVVAADEGVKPQTLDALSAIHEAKIPFVVAFTKIDKRDADIERAKVSLLENNVYLEGLGGSVAYAPISSKSGEGIPALLDLVLLTADLAELFADEAAPASGFVLESTQDPKRGLSATLIVKDGTLSAGVFVVADDAYAPVRFMENFLGVRIKSAGPSSSVRVSGFSALPSVGVLFETVASRKEAIARIKENKEVAEVAEEPRPQSAPAARSGAGASASAWHGAAAELPLVIKADVAGSIEAIRHELAKISNERAVLCILDAMVGAVSENDIKIAQAAGGIVVAFNTPIEASSRTFAERAQIPIESFSVIYDLEQRIAELLAERTPKVVSEEILGEAKVLKKFGATARKHVTGARFISGAFRIGALVKILRRDIEIGRGKITNLQQARADVKEIHTEGDFGLEIETRADVAAGDSVMAYEVVEV